jgi:hypothetical protein
MKKRRRPREPRPDWSRLLSRSLVIPKVMTLRTLDDVRTLLGHPPPETREKETWQHVARCLDRAASGAADVVHVSISLQIVPKLEGVEFRAK